MAQATNTRATFLEFALFIAIGGASALVNLSARYLLDFALPFELAVVLAYGVGMVVGFALFQTLMFRGWSMMQPQRMARFGLVNLFGVTLAWAVSSVMARQLLPAIGWQWHPFEIAHAAGVGAPAICSYFLNKYYTFARCCYGPVGFEDVTHDQRFGRALHPSHQLPRRGRDRR